MKSSKKLSPYSNMTPFPIKEIKTNMPVSLSEAEHLLETNVATNSIQALNWNDFSYLPGVSFRIGHSGSNIFLKYYVSEKYIRALVTRTNGDVYKDSCVEFFISLDGENYYNFEFNCIGTIHLAWGPDRNNRRFIDTCIVEKTEIRSSLGNQPFSEKKGGFEWEMMIRIPLECLAFSRMKSLKGLKAKANFYKCGDETQEPHYVSWMPVKTNCPDFHRPEFFADILFE